MNWSEETESRCELAHNEQLLRAQPLLAPLSRDVLRLIAYLGERRRYGAGEEVLGEGEPAESAVLLVGGGLTFRRGDKQLAALMPGAMVGAMALLGRFPWPYSLLADTASECLLLPRRKIRPQLLAHPEALAALAESLIETALAWEQQRLARAGEAPDIPGLAML